jgi:hypothetical protein
MALACVCLVPARLLAADAPGAAPPDFRGKVMLAYGAVLALVILYLLVAGRRHRRLDEDLRFLEQRLAAARERDASNSKRRSE